MAWNYESIKALVEPLAGWVVELEGDCLSISNDEGIDTFLYLGGQQIIVEAPLFALENVTDSITLNDIILRTHQLQPLTTIGIKSIGDKDYYVAFGALSANSHDNVIIEEIETLFANISEFLDLYSDYLKQETI